jgi:glyoxylase I family protein
MPAPPPHLAARPPEGLIMSEPKPIAIENFSHICIGVSDIEKSKAFYTAVLGMDVVFDVELEGAGLDAVTGGAAQNGRMIGGLIGDAMVELLDLGEVPPNHDGPHLGYTNISFRVTDLDETYQALGSHHPDVRSQPVVDIGGVRMFFIHDPDGTPIEILELPGGAHSTLQLWRPTA